MQVAPAYSFAVTLVVNLTLVLFSSTIKLGLKYKRQHFEFLDQVHFAKKKTKEKILRSGSFKMHLDVKVMQLVWESDVSDEGGWHSL